MRVTVILTVTVTVTMTVTLTVILAVTVTVTVRGRMSMRYWRWQHTECWSAPPTCRFSLATKSTRMHSTLDIFYQIFILFLSLLHIFSLFTSLNVLSAGLLSVFLNHFLLFFPASYFFLYAVFLFLFNPLLLALPLLTSQLPSSSVVTSSLLSSIYLFTCCSYFWSHVLSSFFFLRNFVIFLLISPSVLIFLRTQCCHLYSHVLSLLFFLPSFLWIYQWRSWVSANDQIDCFIESYPLLCFYLYNFPLSYFTFGFHILSSY